VRSDAPMEMTATPTPTMSCCDIADGTSW
jgi:hypothetical protein